MFVAVLCKMSCTWVQIGICKTKMHFKAASSARRERMAAFFFPGTSSLTTWICPRPYFTWYELAETHALSPLLCALRGRKRLQQSVQWFYSSVECRSVLLIVWCKLDYRSDWLQAANYQMWILVSSNAFASAVSVLAAFYKPVVVGLHSVASWISSGFWHPSRSSGCWQDRAEYRPRKGHSS